MRTETDAPGSAGIPAGEVSANRRTFLKTLASAGTGLALAGVASAEDNTTAPMKLKLNSASTTSPFAR